MKGPQGMIGPAGPPGHQGQPGKTGLIWSAQLHSVHIAQSMIVL